VASPVSDFDTVLVANRGEIACRVIRTLHAMGLGAVAVFSEADADAPHCRLADRAVCIGPPPAADSYLDIDALLQAAAATGATAVHPGYGFLAENADFARACGAAGLTFIGPTPEAMAAMGDKAEAKRLMTAAGVPCVPGYHGDDQSDAAFETAAQDIGFPLMVKAAAGGGGRGMRRVETPPELPGALALARAEALAAFGAQALILERAVAGARHVEVQVLADAGGHTIHLGERDCSIQRRHQKIVEEAPCPALTTALREDMGSAAISAARAIGYRGAGTVEFLLEADGRFWFLEMNTRLQVEHAVTELITGIDLVERQIRIARGEPLELSQDDIRLEGHAIEARLYMEDPAQDFRPTTGRIQRWRRPTGAGLRVDEGICDGQTIGPWYDALAAKLVAWGPTRESARGRLVRGLRAAMLFGPPTNKDFLIACLEDDRFVGGAATTDFLSARPPGPPLPDEPCHAADAAAAVLRFRLDRDTARAAGPGVARELLDWSSGLPLATHYDLMVGERRFQAEVRPLGPDRYRVSTGEQTSDIGVASIEGEMAQLLLPDGQLTIAFMPDGDDGVWLSLRGRDRRYRRLRAGPAASDAGGAGGDGRVLAAMHGLVDSVAVAPGERVAAGEPLLVVEAMKMQQEILAPVSGMITAVHVAAGQQVSTGALLVTIETDT
jgi:geranyl-CoA carboxylase alpha subunit